MTKKPTKEAPHEHLSDYERAVCYYTLPRVVHPLTFGLIAVYVILIIEALGALVIGVVWNKPVWLKAGAYSGVGIVLLGVVMFFVRALINQFRERSALAVAHSTPDAANDDELPDPFKGHTLLRCHHIPSKNMYEVTDNFGEIQYVVEMTHDRRWWKVCDLNGKEVLRARRRARCGSFLFQEGGPAGLVVCEGADEIATVRRRFSFTHSKADIHCELPEPVDYRVVDRAVYSGDNLIGRIYRVRESLFLDVAKEHMNKALLAHFVTLA